jgi:hypothetical protein
MIDRIGEIIENAERRLKAFYSSYGEWDGKKISKKDSKESEKDKFDKENNIKTKDCFFKNGPVSKPKIIKRIGPEFEKEMNELKEINTPKESVYFNDKMIGHSNQKEQKIPKKSSNNLAIDPSKIFFEGLSSREIINKIKDLTGEHIKICVKSKKNVIKHALNILKEKGFIL